MGGWVTRVDLLGWKLGSGKSGDEALTGEWFEWECCEFEWEEVWLVDEVSCVLTLNVLDEVLGLLW